MEPINRVEPFNLDRVCNDYLNGSLEYVSAYPDFGDAHQPHIDLNVRPTGAAETISYRIYDTVGTANLRDACGPGGLKLP